MAIDKRALEKAKTMRSEKLGSWFEGHVQEELAYFQECKPLMFHRFPDSKAAGNLIAVQPSDYLVGTPLDAFLLECKASKTHESLKGCLASNVTKEQAVKHFLWHRCKHSSLFVFISVKTGMVEMWNGQYVAEHRRKGLRMTEEGIISLASCFYLRDHLYDTLFIEGKTV